MNLSVFETILQGDKLDEIQLTRILKTLSKIIDKGGVTVVCSDALITSYNCNKKRKLTK